MKQRTERRIRGGIIMAELGPEDLEAFLAECGRHRRTSGFLGGQIISDWIKQRTKQETTPPNNAA